MCTQVTHLSTRGCPISGPRAAPLSHVDDYVYYEKKKTKSNEEKDKGIFFLYHAHFLVMQVAILMMRVVGT